jgi:predicted nucleotidyltransferase component of viral defense system
MNSYKRDYTKLYQLQDKFLLWWKSLGLPFYLTGGTALGRFYLNHRFSEDLDFFMNSSPEYSAAIATIRKNITPAFTVGIEHSLFSDDFTRLFISEDDVFLKIEFVNDVAYVAETPIQYVYGRIDKPLNILSNKLSAIVGRDEPKDIFDIITISRHYSFNWLEVFNHAKQKAVINEIDVEQRLHSFPIALLQSVDWLIKPIDLIDASTDLRQIADDFLLGKQNSLGKNKPLIESASPFNF